jgi:hypothetical protein
MPLTCPSNDNALSQVERSKRAVERAGTATGTARMHCGLPLLTALIRRSAKNGTWLRRI